MLARVLCLSIIGHGLLLLAVIEAYRLEVVPYVGAPPWPGRHRVAATPVESDGNRPLFGEAEGTGLSLASADLPTLLQAREADVQQPFLSLDPMGMAPAGNAPGDALDPGRSAIALADAMPPPESEPLPGTAIGRPLSPHRPARVLGLGEREEPKPEPDPLVAGATEPAGAASARARPPVAGGARPADFAPASDRVMDGFARVESAVMSPGGAVARQGRLIRFPRPVWTLGSYADVWSGIGLPIRFVIEMQLDEAGAVRSARLLEGTGRPSIDRPILVAAHGARLDPTRDESGHPRADTIAFVLTVR